MRSRLAFALVLTTLVFGATGAPRAARRAPKLVVLLAVDQFRADYVDRYEQDWTGGLRRLLDTGARFTGAAYPYAQTLTCVGHTTISTGTLPYQHGLIGNNWFDREAGKSVQCTDDAEASMIPYMNEGKGGHSLARLLVTTLSDELRAQLSPTPRVAAFSLKARAAMTLAGHKADALAWFEDDVGWVTSSAYSAAKVPFVQSFVDANPVDAAKTQSWTKMLPATAYLGTDDVAAERPPSAWSRTFPHPYTDGPATTRRQFYDRWTTSPASDEYLARLAIASVKALGLGQQGRTDFLAVSFSALDLVGHHFGPQSQEVQDTLARLDRTLGTFFQALDELVGRGQYVVALSADHGVSPSPESPALAGFNTGRLDEGQVTKTLEAVLSAALGPGTYVADVSAANVYLAKGIYEKVRAQPALLASVKAALLAMPGIAAVYETEELSSPAPTSDPTRRAATLSHLASRSGDLYLVVKPYWMFGSNGTTHGTPYAFDQRVPIFFMGYGVRKGEYANGSTPADVAPTLAHVAGVTLPHPDGRVLAEALTPLRAPAPSAPAPAKKP
ncbi:MAG: alkaline phosphatase family protein [Vicinamibacterales bacterium]